MNFNYPASDLTVGFGDAISINSIPSTATDKETALEALATQLMGKSIAAVFYPDGGGGTSTAKFCTVGVHAFFAIPGVSNAETPIASYVANTGYVYKQPAAPYNILTELDIYGALDGTNNVGELTALQCAIEVVVALIDKGVTFESVTVWQDSQYVVNCYKEWMFNWARNKWKRRDGSPVKNVDILERLLRLRTRLKEQNQRVSVNWVKGHGTDVGNNKADKLATLSYSFPLGQYQQPPEIFKYDVRDRAVVEPSFEEVVVEDVIEELTSTTPEVVLSPKELQKLAKERATVNPFMRQTSYYFITGQERPKTVEQKYMFATLFKDSVFGERHPQNGYSLIVTKTLPPVLEKIEKSMSFINGGGLICEVTLKNLFSSKTYKELSLIEDQSKMPFTSKLASNVLSRSLLMDDKPLATVLNPPLRALLSMQYYNTLDNVLTQYCNGEYTKTDDVNVTDVTDQFFITLPAEGKKQPKTKVVSSFTTAEKMIKVKVKAFKDSDATALLPLFVGSDIPNRNIIGALSDLNPKVSAITVKEGEDAIRYFIIVESDCGLGIFGSLHSNFIKVLA